MTTPLIPVILAGGVGTRLWPVSRRSTPKQFTALHGDRTMIQSTIKRLAGLEGARTPIIVTGASQVDMVRNQAPDTTLIVEPVGRNTAPAAALAALYATADGSDPLLLISPADHIITDLDAFHEAVRIAVPFAETGSLVTFGIVPTAPETGYGYIEKGAPIGGAFTVSRFVEKPNAAIAANYIASGEYLWNSGMFVFRASRYLEELAKHRPGMLRNVREASSRAAKGNGAVRVDPESFSAIEGDSIDYAVMERTSGAVVVPLDAGWNDIGSWAALWDISDVDEDGNALVGDVLTIGTSGSYVRSYGRLVAVIGLDEVIVVETPDALLVSSMEHSQLVKRIVEQLEASGRPEIE